MLFSTSACRGLSKPNFWEWNRFWETLKIVCDTGAVPASPSGSEVCAGIWDFTADGRMYIVCWHWMCKSQGAEIAQDSWSHPCKSLLTDPARQESLLQPVRKLPSTNNSFSILFPWISFFLCFSFFLFFLFFNCIAFAWNHCTSLLVFPGTRQAEG